MLYDVLNRAGLLQLLFSWSVLPPSNEMEVVMAQVILVDIIKMLGDVYKPAILAVSIDLTVEVPW